MITYLWCLWQSPKYFFYPYFLIRDCKKSLFMLFLLEAKQYQGVTANYFCLIYYYVKKLHWQPVKLKSISQWDSECFQSFCCRSITCKRVMKRLFFCWTAFSFHRKFKTAWNELCLSTSPPYVPSSSFAHGISWAVRAQQHSWTLLYWIITLLDCKTRGTKCLANCFQLLLYTGML